jgi:hypothetical protein
VLTGERDGGEQRQQAQHDRAGDVGLQHEEGDRPGQVQAQHSGQRPARRRRDGVARRRLVLVRHAVPPDGRRRPLRASAVRPLAWTAEPQSRLNFLDVHVRGSA